MGSLRSVTAPYQAELTIICSFERYIYLSGHCLLKNDVAEGKMTVRSGWGLYLGGLVGDAPSDIQINNCNADNLDYDIDSRATGSFRNIGALVGRY